MWKGRMCTLDILILDKTESTFDSTGKKVWTAAAIFQNYSEFPIWEIQTTDERQKYKII